MRAFPHPVTRRGVLWALPAGIAAVLTGCAPGTRLTLGAPETYTPPPPGIDELYRRDLLAAVTRLIEGAETAPLEGLGAQGAAEKALASFPGAFAASLAWHRRALYTGAEAEKDAATDGSASSAGRAGSGSDGGGVGTRSAVSALEETLSQIADLREMYVDAALQVSADFARVCASGAAWCQWAHTAVRRHARAADISIAPLALPSSWEAAREVPAVDPPTQPDPSTLPGPLARAQENEWFARYCLEVGAARSSGAMREALLAQSVEHEQRAKQYQAVAEKLGLTPVAPEAGYPLPATFEEPEIDEYAVRSASTSLTDAVELAALVDVEHRPVVIAAALRSASTLGLKSSTLQPLPGIELPEDKQ